MNIRRFIREELRKHLMENDNKNIFPLTLYSVTFHTSDSSDNEYFGTDADRAKLEYESNPDTAFDPVSEQDLHEGDILDNTKFKYKRKEDNILIEAVWDGQVIGFVSLETMYGNGYWYFEGDISEEEYDKIFPEDKYMLVSHLEISQKMFRGEGAAKELMVRAIAKAKQLGFNRVALNASPIGDTGLPLNDLVRFYKSVGFQTFLDQGNNHLMYLATDKNLNEIDNIWNQGGVLLIKGAKLEDGAQRLYATTINNRLGLDRYKKDNSKGQAATMAVLGNQVYRLSIVDGKLKAQGVAWSSEQKQLQHLGLNKFSVGINNNKTPLHWETLKYNNIQQALNAVGMSILNLPDIRWVG